RGAEGEQVLVMQLVGDACERRREIVRGVQLEVSAAALGRQLAQQRIRALHPARPLVVVAARRLLPGTWDPAARIAWRIDERARRGWAAGTAEPPGAAAHGRRKCGSAARPPLYAARRPATPDAARRAAAAAASAAALCEERHRGA